MRSQPMRFKRAQRHVRDEPEISLIAFIDVLLVVLIFLVLSSSYSRLTQVKVKLPVADTQAAPAVSPRINLAVSADGRYAIGNEPLSPADMRGLTERLHSAKLLAQPDLANPNAANDADILLVISADAAASHQAVIQAMNAANRAGLQQLTFMSQRSSSAQPGQGSAP